MPRARLARARATLPEGYQFGDAARITTRYDREYRIGETIRIPGRFAIAWNVIEGEHFESDADRTPVIEGAPVTRSHGVRILDA